MHFMIPLQLSYIFYVYSDGCVGVDKVYLRHWNQVILWDMQKYL